jgi:hypothetical protein
MLNELAGPAAQRGQRDRFTGLVRLLRERLPEVYAANAVYNASHLVEGALESGDHAALAAAAAELAEHAVEGTEVFALTLDRVAYHGHLLVARDMIRRAWPVLRDEEELFDWAKHEYAEMASNLEVHARLEENPALPADDAELRERVRLFFPKFKEKVLARRIDLLTGRATVEGGPADWVLELEPADEGFSLTRKQYVRLSRLFWEFVHFLRLEGVPACKGDLAREGLLEYLVERACGMLTQRGEPPRNWKGPGGGPTDWLCPERTSLDRFLATRLNLLDGRPYHAAAMFEAVPAWLRFLETRGLVSAERRRQAVDQLRPLIPSLRRLAVPSFLGPGFGAALDAWGREPATSA